MSAPETTLDIIEEMRRFAKRHWMHDEGQNMRMFAARLEPVVRRELGDAQKMREALRLASYFLHKLNMGAVRAQDGRDGRAICCWDVANVVDAALAAAQEPSKEEEQ